MEVRPRPTSVAAVKTADAAALMRAALVRALEALDSVDRVVRHADTAALVVSAKLAVHCEGLAAEVEGLAIYLEGLAAAAREAAEKDLEETP